MIRKVWQTGLWLLACASVTFTGCAPRQSAPEKIGVGETPASVRSSSQTNVARVPDDARAQSVGGREEALFDGKTLAGWRISDFAGSGPVRIEDGKLILEMGTMTGVTYTNAVPTMNYEINLDAMRVEGSDFFCGLTFPVGNDPCSLIVGGWGGGVVGLSSLDGQDAANNETTQYINFVTGRWYHIRLRVTPNRIQAWIDEDRVVDADTTGRAISVRIEVEESRPLGIASWSTTAALRNITLRRLPGGK